MKNQNKFLNNEIANNNIELSAKNRVELSRAEKIKDEIKDNIKYHLYDDDLILL